MDITAERIIPPKFNEIISELKFKNEPIMIQGSAKYASQQNYSDVDLFSPIGEEMSASKIYDETRRILFKTKDDRRFYFIELKVQNTDGAKTKFNNVKDFSRSAFMEALQKGSGELDFIKLDYVIYLDNYFTECSVIYSFVKPESVSDPLKPLEEEVAEYKKDGNLFKAYKRQFSIYNIQGDKEKMVHLTRLFNSPIGKLYAQNSNLKAIKLLLEHYKDEDTKKRAIINLKDIGVSPHLATIDEIIKDNDEKIQQETLRFFSKRK